MYKITYLKKKRQNNTSVQNSPHPQKQKHFVQYLGSDLKTEVRMMGLI